MSVIPESDPPRQDPAGSCVNESTPVADAFGPVYDELRLLAAKYLSGERQGHTLQPTALVNEAFVKMARAQVGAAVVDRNQFFAMAARAMRQVLVDHARKHLSQKRGEGRRRVTLHEDLLDTGDREVDTLQLHEALEQLAALDARLAQIVELRFFGGLGIDEIAAVIGVSDRTVDRDWVVARAWLLRNLEGGAAS